MLVLQWTGTLWWIYPFSSPPAHMRINTDAGSQLVFMIKRTADSGCAELMQSVYSTLQFMSDVKPFDGFQWLAHSHSPLLCLCIIYVKVTVINYLTRVKPTFNNHGSRVKHTLTSSPLQYNATGSCCWSDSKTMIKMYVSWINDESAGHFFVSFCPPQK